MANGQLRETLGLRADGSVAVRAIVNEQDIPDCSTHPAYLEYEANGVAVVEVWMINGYMHRQDGPAEILRDPVTGNIIREEWLLNDQTHRIGGPAVIVRDPVSGKATSVEFWRDGCRMIPPAGFTLDM